MDSGVDENQPEFGELVLQMILVANHATKELGCPITASIVLVPSL